MRELTGKVQTQIDDGILTADYTYLKGEKSNDRFEQDDPDEWYFTNIVLECEHDSYGINKLREKHTEMLKEAVLDEGQEEA